jgi:hypothetical protein
MGTGLEVWDWKEAKDWMASEGRPDGLARGAPSADGWDRWNIVSLVGRYAFSAIGMALHKRVSLREWYIANGTGSQKGRVLPR